MNLILGPVIAAVDAIGCGQWDWWIVAGLVVAVLVAQVVAVAGTRRCAASPRQMLD